MGDRKAGEVVGIFTHVLERVAAELKSGPLPFPYLCRKYGVGPVLQLLDEDRLATPEDKDVVELQGHRGVKAGGGS